MKLPSRVRQLTLSAIGLRKAESIDPQQLKALAASEEVLVLAIGGSADAPLPGEHRTVSLWGLARAVAGVPKHRAIVTHCG